MIEQIKEEIVKATKRKDIITKNILKLVVSEVQAEEARRNKTLSQNEIESIIKKFIKNNEETLQYVKEPEALVLMNEIATLSLWLPIKTTKKEIGKVLTEHCLDAIVGAKSKGQAMGIAMKTLKSLNLPVEGKDVEEVISGMVN